MLPGSRRHQPGSDGAGRTCPAGPHDLAELQAGLDAFARCGGVRLLDIGIARSVMSEAYQLMHLSGEPAGTHAPASGDHQGAPS